MKVRGATPLAGGAGDNAVPCKENYWNKIIPVVTIQLPMVYLLVFRHDDQN